MLKPNTVNHITKGTLVFREGDPVDHVCMVIKGRMEAVGDSCRISLGSGSFIGINDLYYGTYICAYKVIEDAAIYVFPADGEDTVLKILASNKDYRGLAVYYMNRMIFEAEKQKKEFSNHVSVLLEYIKEEYSNYIQQCRDQGLTQRLIPSLLSLEAGGGEEIINEHLLRYYTECMKVPLDIQKAYHSNGGFMAACHIEEQAILFRQIINQCGIQVDLYQKLFYLLVNKKTPNLYYNIAKSAMEQKQKGLNHDGTLLLLGAISERIEQTKKLLEEKTGLRLELDKEWLDQVYAAAVSGEENREADLKEVSAKARTAMGTLHDSLGQIFEYVDYPKEQAEEFRGYIDQFVRLRDKQASDDETRKLRRGIGTCFYPLYEAAFSMAYYSHTMPKAVELFLDFGYVDERLLSEDQLLELCSLEQVNSEGPCKVYTTREWLSEIYAGNKEPSRNEMGQDFTEVLRFMKKQGKINDIKEQEFLNNPAMHVNYEISNGITSTNRVVSGQFMSYVPILHADAFYGEITKSFVTKKAVNEVVLQLLELDYSVFHRETLYVDAENKIEREYIMKQVFPDIILCPVAGDNSCMWQEIEGRRRDTKARFMLPSFTQGMLFDQMIHLFGNFRWEMCKTLQGAGWNNIQIHSLTSEYMDYIQFYKKNRALSEEWKEKVKLQIQKGRNNTREVFTYDYETWMKNEANGALRLNKIVREILATFSPFRRSTREKLIKQPLYEEAFARYLRDQRKKVQELEQRYRALEREGIQLTQPLMETMQFYKDL